MTIFTRAVLLMMSCVILSACTSPNSTPNDANVPDISLSELIRVGDEAAGDSILFGRIYGMAVDSEGRIFVSDRSEQAVLVLSEQGNLVGRIGRQGEGPGEFSRIGNVYIGVKDSVYVHDSRKDHVAVFEPNTWIFVRQVALASNDSLGYPGTLIGISALGPIVTYSHGIGASDDLKAPRFRPIFLNSWSGTPIRRLARLPDHEVRFIATPTSISMRVVPFGRAPVYRYRAGLLYSGWNETIDIAISSIAGDSVGSIRLEHESVRVTQAELDEIPDPGTFDDFHDVKPAYQTFVVDDHNQVWIKDQKRQDTTTTWLVADEYGALVGQAPLPDNVRLRVINLDAERAYASIGSEEDAPMLAVYAITMPAH